MTASCPKKLLTVGFQICQCYWVVIITTNPHNQTARKSWTCACIGNASACTCTSVSAWGRRAVPALLTTWALEQVVLRLGQIGPAWYLLAWTWSEKQSWILYARVLRPKITAAERATSLLSLSLAWIPRQKICSAMISCAVSRWNQNGRVLLARFSRWRTNPSPETEA